MMDKLNEDEVDFDFINVDGETATGGNPDETGETDVKEELEKPSGPPKIHQNLTREQILDAQRRAESPRGLDMSQFVKETGVANLDFEQLLKFKVVD